MGALRLLVSTPIRCRSPQRLPKLYRNPISAHTYPCQVPWGAEVEFAYTTGYDSHGRVSVNRLVDERDCAVILTKPDPDGAGPVLPGTGA